MMDSHFSPTYLQNLLQTLKSSKIYTDLQNAAQSEISKTSVRVSELKKGVQSGLAASGWERKLRNRIYQYLQTHPLSSHPLSTPAEHIKEPFVYLRKAQQAWEKRILKSLNSMCTELNIPLARKVLCSIYLPFTFF
ncbi:TBC1 domain family member 19-like [Ruditapes philippinarum]|uniref:TBC1 domain family member 19-like n=1 Tax=Ruditapes philippinarum TaxID=129788 RepID=UPI00295B8BF3|nr:TBC1 domain family member 19-like [Ruditapes philippinarum]